MSSAPAVSIVTGGASGIGRELTARLVRRGGRVIVADLDERAAEALAERLGEQVTPVGVDVAERGAVEALVEDTMRREGRLDLMVNNAGILLFGPLEEVTAEHWDRALAVNLRAVIDGSQAAHAVMAPRRSGIVLNTGSLAGLMVSPRQLPYTTTKQAVVAYTRAFAIEAKRHGVRAHVLCPGFVDTKLLDEPVRPGRHTGSFRRYAHTLQPRLLTPGEVADAALRGIARRRTVIPVGAFARALWTLERLSPAFMDTASGVTARREARRSGGR
ncbi:MAG: SDR family oxidoreductase [Brachybacterium sp.]|nr:SDR family oxidoreductase [Brachybacterium sp.]